MSKSPTARFSDRVENYVRYRPGYPPEVLNLLRAECGLRPSHIVADVASGTGMFTRLLLENGNPVFAVEPNAEMRKQGCSSSKLFSGRRVVSVAGTAEETTLAVRLGRFRYRRAGGALVRSATRPGRIRAHSEAGRMVRADLE